ncbi:MAG: hypothetical protein AABY44_04925 [Nitrospirota bacterium]
MIEFIRPVRYGIMIGLVCFILGIGWAFWLTLGHDRIHETLQKRMPRTLQIVPESMHGEGRDHKKEEGAFKISPAGEHKEHFKGKYDNPLMELSHRRLTRGHIHAMGLGIITIVISLILAFTSATYRIKTIASLLSGIGGIIYPFAWVVMGYRTPALGPDGAEASVTTIAGPGVALMSLGIFTAIAFLLKDLFTRK